MELLRRTVANNEQPQAEGDHWPILMLLSILEASKVVHWGNCFPIPSIFSIILSNHFVYYKQLLLDPTLPLDGLHLILALFHKTYPMEILLKTTTVNLMLRCSEILCYWLKSRV